MNDLWSYKGSDCQNVREDGDDEAGHCCQSIRRHTNQLWGKFEPYADKHFLEEFRRNPDQRFWEMYLGCCLLDKDIKLKERQKQKGPDFCFEANSKMAWIEAITPTAGQEGSPDYIPELICSSEVTVAQEVPRDKIILRFRAALDEKEKKFRAYEKDGTIRKDDIKIIALSSGAIRGHSMSGTQPFILSAVFPIGHPYVALDGKTGKVVERGHGFQSAVTKANGAAVETLFFTGPSHSDISAVIYSDADIGNPRSQLGDDLLVIHNPLAANPLPRGLLPCASEYWAEDGGDSWAIRHQDAASSQEDSL